MSGGPGGPRRPAMDESDDPFYRDSKRSMIRHSGTKEAHSLSELVDSGRCFEAEGVDKLMRLLSYGVNHKRTPND